MAWIRPFLQFEYPLEVSHRTDVIAGIAAHPGPVFEAGRVIWKGTKVLVKADPGQIKLAAPVVQYAQVKTNQSDRLFVRPELSTENSNHGRLTTISSLSMGSSNHIRSSVRRKLSGASRMNTSVSKEFGGTGTR